jgi:hypothetical protein
MAFCVNHCCNGAEPVFVNVYGAQESIPPAYVAWWAGTTNRVVVPDCLAGNRFLGSLKGLQIRVQYMCESGADILCLTVSPHNPTTPQKRKFNRFFSLLTFL